MNNKSLPDAIRDRVEFLRKNNYNPTWADSRDVFEAMRQIADIIEAWSGDQAMTLEQRREENDRRKYGYVDENGQRIPGDWNATLITEDEREKINEEHKKQAKPFNILQQLG